MLQNLTLEFDGFKVKGDARLKCIKNKCEFYADHDFYSGYFICGLLIRGRSFPKDKEINCIVDEELDDTLKYVILLNKIKMGGNNCD
jgi:hypothetical protein